MVNPKGMFSLSNQALSSQALSNQLAIASTQNQVVPMVVEQSGKGERAFDIFSRLLRERIVFLGSQVDDTTSNLIMSQLLFLEAEDPEKDIYLYINSWWVSVCRDGNPRHDESRPPRCLHHLHGASC